MQNLSFLQKQDIAARGDGSMRKRIGLLLIALICLSACGGPHEFSGTQFPESTPARQIVGLSGDSAFTLSEHEGKVVTLFFGFTYCPDICPTTLSEIQQAYTQADATPDDLSVVFVTVDPERDTPEVAAKYAAAFNEEFLGVHVPVAEQEALKKNYFLFVEKQFEDGETSGDNYLIAHTDSIYLIDRTGNLRTVYRSSDLVIEDFAADLSHLIAN